MAARTVERFESHFRGFDHAELFYQIWRPDQIRGSLIITHGLAEHSECYQVLAKTLAEDGWQVFGWDLRGHGRSEGKRGFVSDFDDYARDFEIFIKLVRAQAAGGLRLALLSHSMGGLITIRGLQTGLLSADVLALSSPALGLAIEVPKFKEAVANVAFRWLPTLTLHNELDYAILSRDPVMVDSYARDNLRHDKVSPGVFLGMMKAFELAFEQAAEIKLPMLLQLAGQDKLINTSRSMAWFELVTDRRKQMIVYPDSYHEIFNDLDREQVIADLRKYLNSYLANVSDLANASEGEN